MTKQEIKEWAAETVNKILHGHNEHGTVHIEGTVDAVTEDRIEVYIHNDKVRCWFFRTDKPGYYKKGDKVVIEVRKI